MSEEEETTKVSKGSHSDEDFAGSEGDGDEEGTIEEQEEHEGEGVNHEAEMDALQKEGTVLCVHMD